MSDTITQTKERPIIFSAPMVRAIFSGKKTQTRRIVKPQPGTKNGMVNAAYCGDRNVWLPTGNFTPDNPSREYRCPFGAPGDRLWVRELWCLLRELDALPGGQCDSDSRVHHCADFDDVRPSWAGRRRPARFMPRWASRITLEITKIRVERLRDIGKDGRHAKDVLAEGITRELIDNQEKFFHVDDSPALAFAMLWDSINGKKYPWASNPWVWVVDFKPLEGAREQ